jgi:hypothetical protein
LRTEATSNNVADFGVPKAIEALAAVTHRDAPRQLALMHALVRFAHIAADDTFTTHDLHEPTSAAPDMSPDHYRLPSLRYDLSKLRAKGLVERIPHSRRYRFLPRGYSICLVF